jgi:hypothetical protein
LRPQGLRKKNDEFFASRNFKNWKYFPRLFRDIGRKEI